MVVMWHFIVNNCNSCLIWRPPTSLHNLKCDSRVTPAHDRVFVVRCRILDSVALLEARAQDIWDVLRAKKSRGIWVGCASRPRTRTARVSAPFRINIVEVFSRVHVEISCRALVHEPSLSVGDWRFVLQRFWQWFFQEISVDRSCQVCRK